jgi:putative DNA primase/helicase
MPSFSLFSAGNLFAVAECVRARYPQAKIILCADDDWQTEGNPGLTKAREATAKVGGYLAVPKFGADRGDDEKDFKTRLYERARGQRAPAP